MKRKKYNPRKWSEEQRRKFAATMATKRGNGEVALKRMPRKVYIFRGGNMIQLRLKKIKAFVVA